MAAERLQFSGYAPIPVGHTVELTYFGEYQGGLFSQGEMVKVEQEPMVRDLDTGITYQTPWHVTGQRGLSGGWVDYPVEPSAGLQVAERCVGRVLACSVLSAPGFTQTKLVTTLLVEALPTESEYR